MRFFFIALWCIFSLYGFSQSAISGRISHNTRWFGQVFINGDIVVERGANLTIEPGSHIILKANFDKTKSGKDPNKIEIIVQGTLIAFGAKGDGEIIFTSDARKPQNADWHGIVLKNIREPSTLSNCIIEYAYKGITCYGSSPVISDSEIRHNYYAGISCEIRSNAIIRNCFLIRNNFAGLVCELGSSPIVEKTAISENQNGVIIFDRSQPDLGRRAPKPGESAGENQIFGNVEANVYNHSTNNIFAQNNIWSSTNVVEIHDKIVDKVDNGSHGTIIFQPVYRRRPVYVAAAPPQPATSPVADSLTIIEGTNGNLPDSLIALSDSAYQNSLAALQERALTDSSLIPIRADSRSRALEAISDAPLNSSQIGAQKVAGFTTVGGTDSNTPNSTSAGQNSGITFRSGSSQPPDRNQFALPHTILERQVDRGQRHYIYRANPEYPSIYQKTGHEGRVIVSLIVGEDGTVADYRIVQSSGEHFSYAVDKALKEMKYEPETYQGQPTKFKLFESFVFKLSD